MNPDEVAAAEAGDVSLLKLRPQLVLPDFTDAPPAVCYCVLKRPGGFLLVVPGASLPSGLLQEAANEGFVGLVGPYTTATAPAVELAENGDWLGVYPPRNIEYLLIDFADAASAALEPLEEGFAECTPFLEEAPMLFPLATAVATYALTWTAQVEGERGAGYVTAEELIPGTEPPLLERRPKAEPKRRPTVAALAVQQESIMEALAALSTQVQQLAKAGSPDRSPSAYSPCSWVVGPSGKCTASTSCSSCLSDRRASTCPSKKAREPFGCSPRKLLPRRVRICQFWTKVLALWYLETSTESPSTKVGLWHRPCSPRAGL